MWTVLTPFLQNLNSSQHMLTNAYYHWQVQSCQRSCPFVPNLSLSVTGALACCKFKFPADVSLNSFLGCQARKHHARTKWRMLFIWYISCHYKNTSSTSANEGLCLWVCVYLTATVPVSPSSRDSSAHRLSISVSVIFTLMWKQGDHLPKIRMFFWNVWSRIYYEKAGALPVLIHVSDTLPSFDSSNCTKSAPCW